MESQLTESQTLDLRAMERTLDGAYWRTCMGLVGASLLAIKLFDRELRYIAVVFVAFGISMFLIDFFRRHSLRKFRFDPKFIEDVAVNDENQMASPTKPFLGEFLTSGNFVFLAGLSAIIAYSSVFAIIWTSHH